jgi:hypothetical protein
LRDARSATAEDVEEIETNAFAANLLIPAQWIRLDVAGYTLDLENEARIDALADRYQVSKQAMIVRLTSLFLQNRRVGGLIGVSGSLRQLAEMSSCGNEHLRVSRKAQAAIWRDAAAPIEMSSHQT